MISWVASTEGLAVRPRQWVAEGGCDAILLCSVAEDALTAAASWNRDTRGDPEVHSSRVDEWADYFAAEGIETIAYGALVVRRRRSGSPWWAEMRLPTGELGPASNQIERMLTSNDLLAERHARGPARDTLDGRPRDADRPQLPPPRRTAGRQPSRSSTSTRASPSAPRWTRRHSTSSAGSTARRRCGRCSAIVAGTPRLATDELEHGAGRLAERLLRLGLVSAA